ncbi:hypothetical protein VPHK367G1_0086 [Vibrio phage K367 g1]|nr:hypothetical protein MYOV072v1_p0019 [Vibrio phage 207E29.1]
MITKKEDLYGTHVLISDLDAAKLYVELIKKFGIANLGTTEGRKESAIEVHSADWNESGIDASFTNATESGLDAGSKRLTLSDLKPRTKTEFVKCVFNHAWEAVKAFEDGEELYTKRSHKDFVLIDNAPDVLRFLYDLHRKVETEIDERQEFIDAACEVVNWSIPKAMGALYDSGKFKLVEK